MTTVHVLVNPASKRGEVDGSKVVEQLESLGYDTVVIRPDSAADVASQIQESGTTIDRLVVVGGDGVIHHMLGAVAQTDISVGIVPSGTGNDFARSLGLPKRRTDAVVAALGDAEPVDLLRVRMSNGSARWVASVLTAGFSGRVNRVANSLAFPKGQQKYTVATLMEVRRLEAFHLEMSVGNEQYAGRCTFFAVANTRHFGGGMAICPAADPSDSRLDVTVVGEVSRTALLLMLPTVFPGRHIGHRAVSLFTGRSVSITLDEELWADGEPLGVGSAEIELVEGAVRIAGLNPA